MGASSCVSARLRWQKGVRAKLGLGTGTERREGRWALRTHRRGTWVVPRWVPRRQWVVAVAVTVLVVVTSARLYVPPAAAYGRATVPPDTLAELRFLGRSLRHGGAERMQRLFPEGYVFSHATYGLAWADVGGRPGLPDALRQQALAEARWALAQLESPKGHAPYDAALDPPYGVFLSGWSAWLLGRVLALQPAEARDAAELSRYEARCEALAAAFEAHRSPFLPAYPGQAWPCDSVVAVAALSNHDRLLGPRLEATVARWVAEARALLDTDTGLLPHQVDPDSGDLWQGSRGSSQALIQRFLPEVDAGFAREQYERFREAFAGTSFLLCGIREHPKGTTGGSDVDSGPLILGLSPSATVVGIGAALAHGDEALAEPLLHNTEALGMPLSWPGEKRYVFGAFPVLDGFLAWSKASRAKPEVAPAEPLPPVVAAGWRWWWHGTGAALMGLAWLPVWQARRRPVKPR